MKICIDGNLYNGVELLEIIDILILWGCDVVVKYKSGFVEEYGVDGFCSDGLKKGGEK